MKKELNEELVNRACLTLICHAERAVCEDLDHAKNDYHKLNEDCPVELHLRKQASILRKYMKINNI
jgi:hypothetical protein